MMMTPNESDDVEMAEGAAGMENLAEVDNGAVEGLELDKRRRGVRKRKRNGGVGTISASKRARDLERQLKKFGENMPAGARKSKETELASMRALSGERTRRKQELENAKKYHMVKFFDKKKIERRLKSDDENVRLQAARDYRYVTEYPRGEKYLALYPKGGHTEESKQKVEEMRRIIESGAADAVESDNEVRAEEEEAESNQDDFFLAE